MMCVVQYIMVNCYFAVIRGGLLSSLFDGELLRVLFNRELLFGNMRDFRVLIEKFPRCQYGILTVWICVDILIIVGSRSEITIRGFFKTSEWAGNYGGQRIRH